MVRSSNRAFLWAEFIIVRSEVVYMYLKKIFYVRIFYVQRLALECGRISILLCELDVCMTEGVFSCVWSLGIENTPCIGSYV